MRAARLAAALGLLLLGASAAAEEGVERFFAGCPARSRWSAHRDDSALDVHALAYTTSNLLQLELVRLADWVLDLPVPAVEVRPIDRTLNGIRIGYNRAAGNLPMRRVGEFVDALQLRELSLGDLNSTYVVATGGDVNPGSGTIVRLNKLVDWTQHVVGDVNRLLGWSTGSREGYLRWPALTRSVDAGQRGVIRVFHRASVVLAKSAEATLSGLERGAERLVNVRRAPPHAGTTVFLRVPLRVYRAHELWILEHARRMYVGTPEELAGLTHAAVFHARGARTPRRQPWWTLGRFGHTPPDPVIVMTGQAVFAGAPAGLRPYVVPAAWVLAPRIAAPAESDQVSPFSP
jgi:hypothetical protein